MSERDFAMALAVLAEAFGEKLLTPVRIDTYHKALRDIPLPLFQAAVQRAIHTRTFFPKVSELRADAEFCRHGLIQANPYAGCAECESSIGWRPRLDQPRSVERCPCFARHQDKLALLGVGPEPLALPAARDWTDPQEVA